MVGKLGVTNVGDTANNVPPPSTIAAQLVRNHAESARGVRRTDDAATFHQLLQEIMSQSATPETDAEVNHKLINVVIEAGLDSLFQDDPFAPWDTLLPQAIDSLSVIRSTIHRQPEVLFLGDSRGSEVSSTPHMLLWLFPKILALACHQKGEQLVDSLQSLLSSTIASLSRSLDFWQYGPLLSETCRDCAIDLLAALETQTDVSRDIKLPINIALPPSRSLASIWPESQQVVAIPSRYQYHVTDAVSAIKIVRLLVLTIGDLAANELYAAGQQVSAASTVQWTMEVVLRSIQALGQYRHLLDRNQCFVPLVTSLLYLCKKASGLLHVLVVYNPAVVSLLVIHLCRSISYLFRLNLEQAFPMQVQQRLADTVQTVVDVLHQGDMHQDHDSVVAEIILPELERLASDRGRYGACHTKLQDATAACLGRTHDPNLSRTSAADPDGDLVMTELPPDGAVPVAAPSGVHDVSVKGRRIRRKKSWLAGRSNYQLLRDITAKLVDMLSRGCGVTLDSIATIAPDSYAALDEHQRSTVWQLLSIYPCVANDCLGNRKCSRCNTDRRLRMNFNTVDWHDTGDSVEGHEIFGIISNLFEDVETQQSDKHRVMAMLAIRSFLLHNRDLNLLDFGTAVMAQWCLSGLHSSVRELRIAAGRTLVVFLRHELPRDLRDKNRRLALNHLRELSAGNMTGQHESLILAWGQIAIVCGDEELNLCLLRLVEYLGHPNLVINSLALSELEAIAECLHLSPQALMRPFYRSLAVAAVQDLDSKPQKIQLLVDLLGMNINQFLRLTETETLPTLVLTKKREIVQRIARAREPATSVQEVCLQPLKNLAAILALQLMQPSADVETSAIAALAEIAPGFRERDLVSLVKLDPVAIACDLLQTAADDDAGNVSRAYKAIQTLALLNEGRSVQAKANAKASRMIASFFEAHVLGILTAFSRVIENTSSHITEKLRCVKGIEQMIKLAKTSITIALPQIRACLQSAMDQEGLQDTAFSCWLGLLGILKGEDVVGLVDHTFALIVQHWAQFSSDLQEDIYEAVGNMLRVHSNLIRENVITIPTLASIPLMSKFDSEIRRLKDHEAPEAHVRAFARRIRDENPSIVLQALQELVPWLEKNQSFLHESVVSEQPKPIVAELTRALLNAAVKHEHEHKDLVDLCARCLGIVGCLDPNRIETNSKKRQMLVTQDFERASETIDWVALTLEDVIVPAFKSCTNSQAQGFLAYVMQELVRFCGFNEVAAVRLRASQASPAYLRWLEMPEGVRNTLTPFLNSRYILTSTKDVAPSKEQEYPIFQPGMAHKHWLRTWVYAMLWRPKGENPTMIFPVLARIVRGHDLSIAAFLLPYVALNIVLGGTEKEISEVGQELLTILSSDSTVEHEKETLKLCSENVFTVLDYMSKWLQDKKRTMAQHRSTLIRAGRQPSEFEEAKDLGRIASVERIVDSIPPDIIARRAIDCHSYARALLHWEDYMREQSQAGRNDDHYQRLYSIYTEIDEPDGLDGISAHLNILTPEQEAFQHRRAGRWTAAQSWYEIELASKPKDNNMQIDLLNCLRDSGQFSQILMYSSYSDKHPAALQDSFSTESLLPFVTEACWYTNKFEDLEAALARASEDSISDFNIGVGRVLLAMKRQDDELVTTAIAKLREHAARGLTSAATTSLQASHDALLKLQAVYEIEALSRPYRPRPEDADKDTSAATNQYITKLLDTMDKRLAVVGSYISDKQYLLGIRRAVMQLSNVNFDNLDIGTSWLTTAKLARKADTMRIAYDAVSKAFKCDNHAARIERARLLWRENQHRQAIQMLEGAMVSGAFASIDGQRENRVESRNGGRTESVSNTGVSSEEQNILSAKAHLLLAKWLDASGQTQALRVTSKYQEAARTHTRWEKGHYYLGKHYNKLLDAEKTLPPSRQSDRYVFGEITKLVIENYLRSIPFGSKYWYETIPKIITLWLDMGEDCLAKPRGEGQAEILERKTAFLGLVHRQIKKYIDRTPAYVFYNALPQMISRISHPNPKVFEVLSIIISKIVAAHPSQSLWSLLAVVKSSSHERASRGVAILNKLKDPKHRSKSDAAGLDLRTLIMQGQKLSEALLQACEIHIESRTSNVSLSKDLNFNHKLAPSALVVPLESTLTANTPAVQDAHHIRKFIAFAQDRVTISSFYDDVLVLSSLQRPRKLSVRGSDGNVYGLLCKPKDDLRKDQRLMEFNTVINRALKRDARTSKRQLYIKTYGVTPLSEESGIIEWVEGIKPLRDILLKLYQRKGIQPNYNELRQLLNEASKHSSNVHIFTDKVLKIFPPILHEWFTETFPDPESWFTARLRYTRSSAVMSIVGHVLGLGDRHGENILLTEGTGGVFHVDFNCLFDKGLTFEKPELVPFRLTHNMVDAMGAYGVEGPFRRSAELTLRLLRQYSDTLMNVLETFVHDPTTDFIGKKKRVTPGVPETPQEVLDSVQSKLRGFLKGESVPLGVEGYVDALVDQATSPWHLCQMYIGWCAFL